MGSWRGNHRKVTRENSGSPETDLRRKVNGDLRKSPPPIEQTSQQQQQQQPLPPSHNMHSVGTSTAAADDEELKRRKASTYSLASSSASSGRDFPERERRVHAAQDSLFSTSSGFTNYRGFFNLTMILLVVSNGRVALENIMKYGVLVTPLEYTAIFIRDPLHWPNLGLLIASNVSILLALVAEKALANGMVGNRFAATFYPTLIVAHLVTPVVVTLFVHSNPLFSAFALVIYVIEALKLVSWAHVNYWWRTERSERLKREPTSPASSSNSFTPSEKSGKKRLSIRRRRNSVYAKAVALEKIAEAQYTYPRNLTLSNIYFFMMAPTLCYELKFPRAPKRRIRFILKRVVELVFLAFLVAALCQQWVMPLLRNSIGPFSQLDITRMMERVLKLAIPNHIIWLLLFYILFHSLLNLQAELMRFADREFYRDFWNAECISYFWRTWNIPVHRWALRHVYRPIVRAGYSKWTAAGCVFFISALLHEYLVSVPLNIFRLYAFYGMLAQLPLSYITDKMVKGGHFGNIVVWLGLILGQPMSVLMYVHDWYVEAHASSNGTTTIFDGA